MCQSWMEHTPGFWTWTSTQSNHQWGQHAQWPVPVWIHNPLIQAIQGLKVDKEENSLCTQDTVLFSWTCPRWGLDPYESYKGRRDLLKLRDTWALPPQIFFFFVFWQCYRIISLEIKNVPSQSAPAWSVSHTEAENKFCHSLQIHDWLVILKSRRQY